MMALAVSTSSAVYTVQSSPQSTSHSRSMSLSLKKSLQSYGRFFHLIAIWSVRVSVYGLQTSSSYASTAATSEGSRLASLNYFNCGGP